MPVGENRINYFLEADRSTTTHARFEQKLAAYWHYRQQKLHERKYGIRKFRTLTIATTAARAENLCRLAARTLPPDAHKFFLFGTLANFSLTQPASILEPAFTTPRDPEGTAPVSLG